MPRGKPKIIIDEKKENKIEKTTENECGKLFVVGKNAYILYIPFPEQEFVELRQIFVDEELRRTGIGRELIKELEKIARGLNVHWIRVASDASLDDDFGSFLLKVGFVRTGNEPFCWEINV